MKVISPRLIKQVEKSEGLKFKKIPSVLLGKYGTSVVKKNSNIAHAFVFLPPSKRHKRWKLKHELTENLYFQHFSSLSSEDVHMIAKQKERRK